MQCNTVGNMSTNTHRLHAEPAPVPALYNLRLNCYATFHN